MTSVTIPYALRTNVVDGWGALGSEWLSALPGLVDEIARDWSLEVGPPYALSLNWVAPATRADGSATTTNPRLWRGVVEGGPEVFRDGWCQCFQR